MNVVKWILALLIILTIVFLAVGFVNPEFSYMCTVKVEAPVEKSYSVFMDFSNLSEWMDTLENIEQLSGDGNEIGSVYKLTFNENGEEVVATETVTVVEHNARYTFDIETDPFLGTVDITFTALDSANSEITSIATVAGKNVFWRALLYLMRDTMQQRAQEQYERLAEVIEEKR